MGTLLDLASLVVVPSGYKEDVVYSVKPTDGSGDLDFTRSNDTATRVNSAGLIEKVRTNLLLQSNTFSDVAWTKVGGTTLTGSQSDPFGGSNAWKWEATGAATIQLAQNPATSNLRTASIYAKAGNISTFSMWKGSGVTFDLSTGTITSGSGTITNVGGGWYRCTVDEVGISHNPYFTAAASGDHIFVAFAQMEDGAIATDYIPTTSAAVSVGMTANVPRLDYSGGGCPKLLLEPQRVNYQVFSENSAQWAQPADGLSVAYNTTETLDPAGFNGAEKVTSTGGNKRMFSVLSNPAGAFAVSAFIKAGTGSTFGFVTSSGSLNVQFDIATGVVTNVTGTGSIVDYGNGWYRCIAVGTAAGSEVIQYRFFNDNGLFVYFYGAQFEEGSYATSYIPTLAAAVTRGADACFKTGISSLIGQTEGTFFAEVTLLGNTGNFNVLNTNNNAVNSITLHIESSQVRGYVYANSSLYNSIIGGSVSVGNTYKMAYAYKSGDAALYLNGVQIGIASQTWAFSASVDKIEVADPDTYFSYQEGIKFAQALLFPTRLTNTQLAELTTP